MNVRAIASLLLLLATCGGSFCQATEVYILHGKIEGLPDRTKVYLLNANRDTVNQTISKRNEITLVGQVEGANFFFLLFDTTVTKKYSNALWIVNDTLYLTGNINRIKEFDLSGSEPQRVFEAYMRLSDSALSMANLTSLMQFTKAYSQSMFTPYALTTLKKVANPQEIAQIYSSLQPNVKNSYWGKRLTAELRTDSLSKLAQIGKPLLDFKVSDPSGNKIRIMDLISKNEYTLLDFWASWCAPCRKAIPVMKKVLEQYKSQGFGIIGVSTDTKLDAWEKALKEEMAPWIQVIDNVEFAGKNLYGVQSIPGYILVDRNGTIVSKMLVTQHNKANASNNLKLSTDLSSVINSLFLPLNHK